MTLQLQNNSTEAVAFPPGSGTRGFLWSDEGRSWSEVGNEIVFPEVGYELGASGGEVPYIGTANFAFRTRSSAEPDPSGSLLRDHSLTMTACPTAQSQPLSMPNCREGRLASARTTSYSSRPPLLHICLHIIPNSPSTLLTPPRRTETGAPSRCPSGRAGAARSSRQTSCWIIRSTIFARPGQKPSHKAAPPGLRPIRGSTSNPGAYIFCIRMTTKRIRSDPTLGALITSRARVEILKLLVADPERPAIPARSCIPDPSASSARRNENFARLEGAGIVTATTEGNRKYYQANRQSPVFPEIKALLLKTVGLGELFRDHLQRKRDLIQLAFIFGSYAGGFEGQQVISI